MRKSCRALAAAVLALPVTALAADDHRPPVIAVQAFAVNDAALAPQRLEAGRALLSGPGAPSIVSMPVPQGDFAVTALLGYAAIEDGDSAGLALADGAGAWIGIQLERITPALLIAVRSHPEGEIQPAGRLLATTAVPGSSEGRIHLRIERRGNLLDLSYSPVGGAWQVLAQGLETGAVLPLATVYAIDGAERR